MSLNEEETAVQQTIGGVTQVEEESSHLDKSKSAEEIASAISQQQQLTFAKSNENLIVNSFVSFFEPLIQNLDTNVQALRLLTTNSILESAVPYYLTFIGWSY